MNDAARAEWLNQRGGRTETDVEFDDFGEYVVMGVDKVYLPQIYWRKNV